MTQLSGLELFIIFLLSLIVGLSLFLCLYLGLTEALRPKFPVSFLVKKESLTSRISSTETVTPVAKVEDFLFCSRRTSPLSTRRCFQTWGSEFTTITRNRRPRVLAPTSLLIRHLAQLGKCSSNFQKPKLFLARFR